MSWCLATDYAPLGQSKLVLITGYVLVDQSQLVLFSVYVYLLVD